MVRPPPSWMSHVHTPPTQTVWRMALPRNAAAVPVARALVRRALTAGRTAGQAGQTGPAGQTGRPTAVTDTAELLTAELVANALEHTATNSPIELVVEMRPGGCRVEVHDRDPVPPGTLGLPGPCEEPDPWQEHGRGLLLLRTLSSSCGHRPTDSGKAVWFTLSSLPRPQQRHPAQ
jgi:anti-sigma regulatory factor (Ser/Thr protein kinase)